MAIDETASVANSTLGDVELREYVIVYDSEIGSGARVYEQTSVKKSVVEGPTDSNANCYVKNARLGERVQVGPNASLVGVTHDLSETGMEFRNDRFEEVVVEDGAFVGSGAVVLPGVTVGENAVVGAGATVANDVPSECVVRTARENAVREL